MNQSNTMTTPTTAAGNAERARLITPEDQPVFPCWGLLESGEWKRFRTRGEYECYITGQIRSTHWHPDQPTAPTCTPQAAPAQPESERARFEAMKARARERALPWVIEGTDKVKPMRSTELIQMLYSHEIAATAEQKADGWQERVNALVADLISYGQTVGAFDNAALASGEIKALIAKHSSAAVSPGNAEAAGETKAQQGLAVIDELARALHRLKWDEGDWPAKEAALQWEKSHDWQKWGKRQAQRLLKECPQVFAPYVTAKPAPSPAREDGATAETDGFLAKIFNDGETRFRGPLVSFARRLEQERDTARQQLAEARAEGERLRRIGAAVDKDNDAALATLRTLASELAGALEESSNYWQAVEMHYGPDHLCKDAEAKSLAVRDAALLAFRSSTPAPAPAPDKLKGNESMKTLTEIIPEIIDEAKTAGCENAEQINGFLAAEVSRLRNLLKLSATPTPDAGEDGELLDFLQANHDWILCAETDPAGTFSCGSNGNFQNWATKVPTVREAIRSACAAKSNSPSAGADGGVK